MSGLEAASVQRLKQTWMVPYQICYFTNQTTVSTTKFVENLFRIKRAAVYARKL